MKNAALLVAHGTVDDLSELPEFAARIRRGHPAPPELLAELRRRYEAIGGQSPLNAINRRLASRLEEIIRVPVRVANRLARPFVKDVMGDLAQSGVERIVAVPLAQYSAHVYAGAVDEAAAELARGGARIEAVCAPSWGEEPALLDAYATAIAESLAPIDPVAQTTLILSAHSLPLAAIRAGDPYEREVRAAAAKIGDRVVARAGERALRQVVGFQSQGMSAGPGGRPVEWLGPDLPAAIEECRARGESHVVFAPIGFLADHVEILYDLDIEARGWVEERGMTFHRTRSLNDSEPLVRVLADLTLPLLHRERSP
jgi:protoporphyrin/coproporphyrin ferrochelatase